VPILFCSDLQEVSSPLTGAGSALGPRSPHPPIRYREILDTLNIWSWEFVLFSRQEHWDGSPERQV
jgi:hypothetical protein